MAGRIRDEDVAEVRIRTRIDQVIGEHVTLRPAGGGSLKGLCPFHDERSPSFHVTPSKGFYHCFGCQAGGDAITFLMQLEGLTFAEAVEKLAARAGIQLRYVEGGTSTVRDPGQRARLVAVNTAAAAYFVEQLATSAGEQARRILAERGFEGPVLEDFGVGYAPGGWQGLVDHLKGARVPPADLLAAGVAAEGRRGPYDRFRNRIIWPIRDLSGDVVGFGARRIDDADESPKYLNTPETPIYRKSHVLFGLDLARKAISTTQQAVVVEGYTDVMAAHLAGVANAVATCGTAFGIDHVSVLRRLLMDDSDLRGQVVFTFDSDKAGRSAALRAFELDQKFVAHTFVAVAPDGLDPAELRLRHGDEAVRRMVDSKVPLFEFALRQTVAQVDTGTAEGRLAGLRAAVPVLRGIRDVALRPEYARVVAGWLGLPEERVLAAVAGRERSAAGGRSRPEQMPGARDSTGRRLERLTLQALLQQAELAGQWFDILEPEAFAEADLRSVHQALQTIGPPEGAVRGPVWVDRVLSAAADDQTRRRIQELLTAPLPVPDADPRYVRSLVARLLDRDARRRQADLQAALGRPDAATDSARRGLLEQYRALEEYRLELQAMAAGDEVGR